jgi:hypothetical protein
MRRNSCGVGFTFGSVEQSKTMGIQRDVIFFHSYQNQAHGAAKIAAPFA